MQYFPFSLEQLRILKSIKAEKSFKAAAKKLYLSQPAVTLQVQNLEKKLDFPIFDRSKKQICFTRTGELVLDYATRILVLCEEADNAIMYLKDVNRNKLIIGSSNTIGTYLLPKIIGLFCRRYSYANINLEVNSTYPIAWGVATGEIDLGIVGGRVTNQFSKSIQIIPFVEDELVLIMPKFHPFNTFKLIRKEDIYELNFIALNKQSIVRENIDKVLDQNNIDSKRLKISFELNSIEAIKSAVQAGMGVAFISIFVLTDEIYLKNINVVKIKSIKIKRTLSIVINSKTSKSKLSRKFHHHLISLFQNHKYKKFLNL
uniref:Probable RuBisCO transcriptional regulator n=1 Tax=Protohalopteris sp. TaxID=2843287 RepID=A0A8F0F772_9PHAE|nr:lysR transcriptional regulator [Protohalopteris sp.]